MSVFRKLGLTLVAALVVPAASWATTNPAASVELECDGTKVRATFTYTGFNPANRFLVAAERVTGAAMMGRTHTLRLDAAGVDVSYLRPPLRSSGRVDASTVVVSASGRVKAEASATVRCRKPPPPPVRATSARLIGPCGDPMYAAVFNNRRGTVPVTFRWRYHQFGVGYTVLQRTIGAGKVFRTGYKHVTGSTATTVRAHGELLLRETTAPGGNYPACR
jgi:hypothetical protein